MTIIRDIEEPKEGQKVPENIEEINKKASEQEPLLGPSDMEMVELLDIEGEPEKPSYDTKDSGE